MLIKKIIRSELDNVLFIIFWFSFLVLFGSFLFHGIIKHPLSIENISNIIWVIACIIKVFKFSNRMLHVSSDNLDSEAKETIEIDKPIERIALAALIIICLIPVIAIFWINRDALFASYTIHPEFGIFSIYASISTGLLVIISDLESTVDIQNKVIKLLLQLLNFLLAIIAIIMLFVYSSHMIESY